LFTNHDTDFTDVTVRDSDGHTTIIHTTRHHPFWDEAVHGWADASQLGVGDQLHSFVGGPVTVVSVRSFVDALDMYDLTVDEVHAYYVVVGGTTVLVHNISCDGIVRYNSAGLPHLAHLKRIEAGYQFLFGKNVAAVRLEVDGAEQALYGFSQGVVNGEWVHSEDQIIAQIEKLRQDGHQVGLITELYSDRRVCAVCDGKLKPYLSSDAKLSWAVLYDDPNPELARLINQQAPEELERMIRANP
jgi:hypothetical protein